MGSLIKEFCDTRVDPFATPAALFSVRSCQQAMPNRQAKPGRVLIRRAVRNNLRGMRVFS